MPLTWKWRPISFAGKETVRTYIQSLAEALVPEEPVGPVRVKHGYPVPVSIEFRSVAYPCVQTACRMDLFTKAAQLGIQTEFTDGQGHRRVTDPAALEIIV